MKKRPTKETYTRNPIEPYKTDPRKRPKHAKETFKRDANTKKHAEETYKRDPRTRRHGK